MPLFQIVYWKTKVSVYIFDIEEIRKKYEVPRMKWKTEKATLGIGIGA